MKRSPSFEANRRNFLQALGLMPLLASSSSLAKTAFGISSQTLKANDPLDIPAPRVARVLQNWTDESSAIVTVLGSKGWSFGSAPESEIQLVVSHVTTFEQSERVLYQLLISNLAPNKLSRFIIYDESKKEIDSRRLQGLDLDAKSPNIAVASCSNYRDLKNQSAIYRRINEQKTDLILFIGDIIYCDSHAHSIAHVSEPPASAEARYIQTWELLDIYQIDPLVPLLTMWDDHDFGQNNGNSGNPYRVEMKSVFRAFYPLPVQHERLSFGPGVAFRMTAFGIDFHFLDDRTFAVERETLWGPEQETWFQSEYRASSNPAWILNGTLFFKYYELNESVEKKGLPSLTMLTNLLRSHRKATALFSGDIHASQVQFLDSSTFGYPTYEITSSAVHSSSARGWLKRSEKDGQIFYYGHENFILLRPFCQAGQMELKGTCVTAVDVQVLPEMVIRV